MDLGQEWSWFPGDGDPRTPKSSGSCLGPLNQASLAPFLKSSCLKVSAGALTPWKKCLSSEKGPTHDPKAFSLYVSVPNAQYAVSPKHGPSEGLGKCTPVATLPEHLHSVSYLTLSLPRSQVTTG